MLIDSFFRLSCVVGGGVDGGRVSVRRRFSVNRNMKLKAT